MILYATDCSDPKGIENLIDYAKGLGMWTVMATNGELLTEEMALALKKKDVSIITKFNAFDQELFEDLVQSTATFVECGMNMVPKGVASVIATGYNAENPTRAGIETVITKRNIDEIPNVCRFALQNNLYANIEMMLPIGRASKHLELIPPIQKIMGLYEELDKLGGTTSRSINLSHYQGINCYHRIT